MHTGMIVVAAGYGSFRETGGHRPIPKVIERVRGLPMVVHPLIAAERMGSAKTVVVVNPRDAEIVVATIAHVHRTGGIRTMPLIVLQPGRFGAADAVQRALPELRNVGVRRVLVTYGDMPEWSADTYQALLMSDRPEHTVTMTTVVRSDKYPVLDTYGRVLRDAKGNIRSIVEVKGVEVPRRIYVIPHVNPSLWIWNARWLESSIAKITPVKKSDGYGDELYMPPLIEIASSEGRIIGELSLGVQYSHEACGVNSIDELNALQAR
ncbi:MAG: NTP transferase domain-containing protein [Candidatus Pacebacteria bacterium]|nr:NTP transferase domain-containing protein [Candidatus Paceibacterota bacterium]